MRPALLSARSRPRTHRELRGPGWSTASNNGDDGTREERGFDSSQELSSPTRGRHRHCGERRIYQSIVRRFMSDGVLKTSAPGPPTNHVDSDVQGQYQAKLTSAA